MDQIRESLNNISELDATQLSELRDQIISAYEAIESEDVSAELVEQMQELANAIESVDSELSAREAQVAELTEMKEQVAQRIRGDKESEEDPDTSVDEEPSPDGDPSTEEVDEEEAGKKKAFQEDETVDEPVAEAAPVAASAETVVEEPTPTPEVETPADAELSTEETPDAELSVQEEATPEIVETPTPEKVETELSVTEEEAPASDDGAGIAETELSQGKDSEAEMSVSEDDQSPLQAPDSHRPVKDDADEVNPNRATLSIVAAGDIQGVTMGTELPDMMAVADAMASRMRQIRRTTGGDGETFSVATIVADYPEARKLSSGDVEGNNKKIKDVASPEAIVAAGGFCAPVEVSYDVFGFGVLDRPVKDSLASFSADRGGIRFTESPVLGDLDAAVSTWTLQDDIDAATAGGPDPTKPCLRVLCGDEVVVYVDAIPLCLTFGNLQSRAFPEQVARNNELAMITHARYAENRLLTRIGALSTQVSAAEKLGAARDFFNQVDVAAAGYRSRHRLDATESLRVIVPLWLKNLIRTDIVNSMPGGDDQDRFGIADNIVNNWFKVRHINVTWTLDGEAASGGNPAQIFGAQNNGALLDFPSKVIWYLFAEGTFLFLDGGTLDLGLVRDSTLNATNDYKMFVETFEAVAKVGIESLRVVSSLDATGAVAGTVDPSGL